MKARNGQVVILTYVLLWKNDLLKSLPHWYRLQKLECTEFIGLFFILDFLIHLFSEKKIEPLSLMVWKCPRNRYHLSQWKEIFNNYHYPVFTTMETVEVATDQNFWRFNFYGPYGKYWIEMIVNDSFQMAQVIRFLGHFQTITLTDSIFFSENKYFFSQFGLPNKQASHWIETGPVQLFGRPEQLVDIVSEIVTLFKSLSIWLRTLKFALDFVVS